jgi:hypothetical protein
VLITAAIIGIITGVLTLKYGAFNNIILLKNQAYEIALDLREAQNYSIGAKGINTEFREDYGLHFDVDEPNQYILFMDRGDIVENGRHLAFYDEDQQEMIGSPIVIDSRFVLRRICINVTDENDLCPLAVNDVSITFRRPNFDAQFASKDVSENNLGMVENVRIEVSNAYGDRTQNLRTIVVNGSGQITIE